MGAADCCCTHLRETDRTDVAGFHEIGDSSGGVPDWDRGMNDEPSYRGQSQPNIPAVKSA